MKTLLRKFKVIAAKRAAKVAAVGVAVSAVAGTASAQTNASLPVDPSLIYTSLQTPFQTALVWVIGATAVLGVIAWIRRAIARR